MSSEDQIALALLNQVLAGERGILPLQLAMLLEKSARLARGDVASQVDADYKDILLPELVGINITNQIREDVIARLCIAVSNDPDQALISVVATTGTSAAIKTLVKVLVNPPRALKADELTVALSYLSTFLPILCVESPGFVSCEEVASISKLAEGILASKESVCFDIEKMALRDQAVRIIERLRASGPGLTDPK
ncbi:MAG: hypothetical protein WAN35_05995 [Terracidiphilus sp.]